MTRALILAVALLFTLPAQAQSSSHWSQLIEYVRTLANRSIDDRARIEALEAQNARTLAWGRDVACKYNALVAMLESGTLPKVAEGEPRNCAGDGPAPALE